MAFYRGQKVVCVDATGFEENLVQNEIYTVHSIACYLGDVWIRLCEVRPELGGYSKRRFRPVVERKTDIGFAHEILRKAARNQGADA